MTYIAHITHITHKVKLIFKAFTKNNRIFFSPYIYKYIKMSKRYYQKSKEPHEKYQNLSEEEKNKILSKLY